MRRTAVVALIAGGSLAVVSGAFALRRALARASARTGTLTGIFPSGMPYARVGSGSRTLLWMPGGPGIGVPAGLQLALLPWMAGPYTEAGYTVWIVGRRRNLPAGHTIPDMADDYARLIEDEFGGRVDLVLGESYGGMVGFSVAARHPERFDHIALVVAGYAVGDEAKEIDVEFARLLSEGRDAEASAHLAGQLLPGTRVPGFARLAGAVLARLFIGERYPAFASDVLIEAEAEATFDARPELPAIAVPVLLVAGDRDEYFPREILEETARLIPDCTLRIYEGKGHMGAAMDPRLPQDVLDFVRLRPTLAKSERELPPVLSEVVAEPMPAGA